MQGAALTIKSCISTCFSNGAQKLLRPMGRLRPGAPGDSPMELDEKELNIHTEQDDEGYWIARIFHHPTSSIKISNRFLIEQQAIDEATAELKELILERKKGLLL